MDIAWFLTYRRVGLVKMGKIIIFKVNKFHVINNHHHKGTKG
jgi:hypothetical protein